MHYNNEKISSRCFQGTHFSLKTKLTRLAMTFYDYILQLIFIIPSVSYHLLLAISIMMP